ncbi:hypothetical protein L7F22_011380 [Adiantum nelumboides]|nr:hypothetical protein [Adiantum nelumboides]
MPFNSRFDCRVFPLKACVDIGAYQSYIKSSKCHLKDLRMASSFCKTMALNSRCPGFRGRHGHGRRLQLADSVSETGDGLEDEILSVDLGQGSMPEIDETLATEEGNLQIVPWNFQEEILNIVDPSLGTDWLAKVLGLKWGVDSWATLEKINMIATHDALVQSKILWKLTWSSGLHMD